ncbi:hypothetical protein [Ulvibacterium marinum]|uniref:hypothetical protein n=1 Tax=Ulvibacterium marinum TaxID=2419782 RepID=UPI0024943959|nr:hypothetical protein [Ulvibacterium marinum]
MSKILSSYSFLPWIRQGIANQIQVEDHDPTVKLRAPITVDLSIKADGQVVNPPISQTVGLYGPADIIGIDSRAVVKTEPRNWITNFEPNYLASIDLIHKDYPWRYTPAKPDNKDRLRPWITLVVLEESEFENGKNMADRPLSYINLKIAASEVFPPADQLWAWAHVHVNTDLIEDDLPNPDNPQTPIQRVISDPADQNQATQIKDDFEEFVGQDSDNTFSRIICPRRLEENKAYHAFLIPTFESGRLAGLGLDVEGIFDAEATLNATTSAWEDYAGKTEPTSFPVYYQWYFRTGTVGDFEYLVRLLKPKPVDNRVGRRDMDVRNPGSNIEGIGDLDENGIPVNQLGGILRLGGALQVPVNSMSDTEKVEYNNYNDWAKTPYPREFQKQLAAFINLADDYSKDTAKTAHQNPQLSDKIISESAAENEPDPLITAPLYGRWHALTNRLLEAGDSIPDNNWVHELNLDPRFRVAAGFGTGIIQTNQEKYMEAAWEQIGKVIEANRQIRQAQLAQAVSKYWFNAHVKSLQKTNEGAFMWLTQPMQTRVLSNGLTLEKNEEVLTVHHHVKTSKVPAVAFAPEMRKFMRPRGRMVKTLPFTKDIKPETALVDRINTGEVKPAPEKKVPKDLPTIEKVIPTLKPQNVPGFLMKWMEKHKWLKYLFLGIALLILLLLVIFVSPNISSFSIGLQTISGIAAFVALLLLFLFFRMLRWENEVDKADSLDPLEQTPEAVDDYESFPDFELTLPGDNVSFRPGTSDSNEGVRFKAAQRDVGEMMQGHIEASFEPIKPQLNLQDISAATLRTIDPKVTIPGFVLNNKILIPDRIKLGLAKPEVFKEAMAYPEIDTPMYKPLIDISADLFLPNINLIEQNSISLLETNQKFIEAYMVGLNHEFARELMWREYLTDQRGSYFRQFWDVSEYLFDQEEIDKMLQQIGNDLGEDATPEEIAKKLKETIKERLKDIPVLHRWSKHSKLGSHDNREEPGDNEQEVVLVIRGELLKKYPNAVIYAHRAQWKPISDTDPTPDRNQERELVPIPDDLENNPPRDTVKTPLYEAKVDPDIYFFGFDLTAEEAQGMTEGEPADLEDRAGWFFVIKERPGEPRFGLDIGTTEEGELEVWNDMAWGNVTPAVDPATANGKFLQITSATQDIDVNTNPLEDDDDEKLVQREEDKQFTWNEEMNSAELAYILFQAPVMVAVHGAEMLPKT